MKRFKNILFLSLVFSIGTLTSCELFDDVTSVLPLSESEIVQGLKEALTIGLDASVTNASSVDGYLKNEVIKILLPQEVQDFQSRINNNAVVSTAYGVYISQFNGGVDLFGELATAMNRGAESAAKKAGPIFLDAITSMSFSDARGILDGNETAATDFFYASTNQALFTAFQPEVKTALDQTGANEVYALTYDFLVLDLDPTGFNPTTVGEVLNTSLDPTLDEYATNKAIDGLFYLVGEEEKKIREDPFAWGSAIIERVFGSK